MGLNGHSRTVMLNAKTYSSMVGMSFIPRRQSGFTIVELLIVIVVIAILATISVVAYNGIQQRARDNIRKSDLATIEKALELLYIDHGKYITTSEPCMDTSIGVDSGGCNGIIVNVGDWASVSNMRNLIDEGYVNSVPVDPINDETYHYRFEPWNAGQGGYVEASQAYDLCATLEVGGTYCVNKRT